MKRKTAVLLAGGRSLRFGSNKSYARWRGATLLERGVRNLEAAGFQVIVADGRTDPYPYQGPLQALFGIGRSCEREKILLTACDMPFLKPELLVFLWEESAGFDITVIRIGRRIYPLPGIYSKKAMREAGLLFQKERRDLKSLLGTRLKIRKVDGEVLKTIDPQGQSLVNINTQEDLKEVSLCSPS